MDQVTIEDTFEEKWIAKLTHLKQFADHEKSLKFPMNFRLIFRTRYGTLELF